MTGIVAAALCVMLGQAPAEKETLDANQQKVEHFLAKFPNVNDIPGAMMVLREDPKHARRARHVIVHVRDYHGSEGMNRNQEIATRAVQQDIYDTLRYFMKRTATPITMLYKEGVTTTNEEAVNVAEAAPKSFGHAVARSDEKAGSKSVDLPPPDPLELERGNRESSRLDSMGIFKLSGAWKLHEETGIRLKAAEHDDTNAAGYTAVFKPNEVSTTERRTEIFSKREDVLLQLIAKNDDPIAFVVYGGAHDFSEEIGVWNSRYPNNGFCQIEITPSAYYEYIVLARLPRLRREK